MADWRRHHPEEGELLRYCDGELRARDSVRVARHLDACWDCRTRVDDLRQTIAEYVRFRRDVLDPAQPAPPLPWQNLRHEMARLPVEPGAKRTGLFARRTVWMAACTLTAATGIFFYATRTAPRERPMPTAATAPTPVPTPQQPRLPTKSSPLAQKPPAPEDELRVIAALNRIGADLGDPVEVVRARDRIVVTCIGLDATRLREVTAALAGLPRVAIQLSPQPAVPAAEAPHEVAAPHAVRGPLEQRFSSPAAYEQFVNQVLESSDAIMARAHALRRLAARFPTDVETNMTAGSRATLEDIRRRHENSIAAEVATLDRALDPYFAWHIPSTIAPETPEPWQVRAGRLFTDAAQVDRQLSALVAGAQTGHADPASLAETLGKLKADAK